MPFKFGLQLRNAGTIGSLTATIHLVLLAALTTAAFAEEVLTLDEVVVSADADDSIGIATSASAGTVTARQLESRPLLRPAEVMEAVPGLIVSQHSGDGKANQYYLRGFNLDHGTDFSTSLMDMPVNLPSHAHGQGYTDLNFLIPELVQAIQYRKGTYYAGDGDFSAAGSARIDYVRKLEAPFAQATMGANGYTRLLAAATPGNEEGNLLLAAENFRNDGPWQVPENVYRNNLVTRYSRGERGDGWSVGILGYTANWAATDQIAQRAEAAIGRYGSLDSSSGGNTHRHSVSANFANGNGMNRANVYYIDYGLDLWSNFTYATDSTHGDQFMQSDKRGILGGNAAHTWTALLHGRPLEATVGGEVRHDDIKNALFLTQNRQIWRAVREDSIKQSSVALWGEAQIQWLEKFRSTLGLRADRYQFDVASDRVENSGSKTDALVSPKLALVFGPWNRTEYYANAGYGFHSNDARGALTTLNPDPRPGTRPTCTDSNAGACTGDAVNPVNPLVRAVGYETGVRTSRINGLQSSLALWRLEIASELVFSGDAGTTRPSRPSRRQGIEWSNNWNPHDALRVDTDLSLSDARYTDYDQAGNYIPGAIEQAASIGLGTQLNAAWSSEIRLRYFGPRPLVEDNSVRSAPSTMLNMQLAYKFRKQLRGSLDILNLLDSSASDNQYYYASQLSAEKSPVYDIHTHPAEPRTLRLSLRLTL